MSSVAKVLTAAFCLLVAVGLMVAPPAILLATGVKYSNAFCEATNLSTWAIVQGALGLSVLPLVFCMFSGVLLPAIAGERGREMATRLGAVVGATALCGFCLVALAANGVLIWGSVILWSDSRFSKWQNDTLLCPNDLYKVCNGIAIFTWVSTGIMCCNNRSKGNNSSMAALRRFSGRQAAPAAYNAQQGAAAPQTPAGNNANEVQPA